VNVRTQVQPRLRQERSVGNSKDKDAGGHITVKTTDQFPNLFIYEKMLNISFFLLCVTYSMLLISDVILVFSLLFILYLTLKLKH